MSKKYFPISIATARELIWAQRTHGRGCVFGVAFQRRTDSRDGALQAGDVQVLYGRFGVKKHLRSRVIEDVVNGTSLRVSKGSATYDRCSKNLFCFFVMHRQDGRDHGYRCIPFDGLRWLKLNGVVYKVGQPPEPQR